MCTNFKRNKVLEKYKNLEFLNCLLGKTYKNGHPSVKLTSFIVYAHKLHHLYDLCKMISIPIRHNLVIQLCDNNSDVEMLGFSLKNPKRQRYHHQPTSSVRHYCVTCPAALQDILFPLKHHSELPNDANIGSHYDVSLLNFSWDLRCLGKKEIRKIILETKRNWKIYCLAKFQKKNRKFVVSEMFNRCEFYSKTFQ